MQCNTATVEISKTDMIPFDLITALASKITRAQWIERYEMYKQMDKKK